MAGNRLQENWWECPFFGTSEAVTTHACPSDRNLSPHFWKTWYKHSKAHWVQIEANLFPLRNETIFERMKQIWISPYGLFYVCLDILFTVWIESFSDNRFPPYMMRYLPLRLGLDLQPTYCLRPSLVFLVLWSPCLPISNPSRGSRLSAFSALYQLYFLHRH